jgi:hypothetical protein
MPTATLRTTFVMGNIKIDAETAFTDTGEAGFETIPALAAAGVGSLTTRTDANTGVLTMTAGHGIVTGKVDVYWAAGVRYGMDAVVTVNSIAIDLGAGNDLPDAATAVTVGQQDQKDIGFDGDTTTVVAMRFTRRGHADFQDSAGASLFPHTFGENECWNWNENGGTAAQITGNPVAKVQISNGDSVNTNLVTCGVLYES